MTSSTIKFACPKCLAEVRVIADSAKGQKRKCWRCKATMVAAFDADEQEFAGPATQPAEPLPSEPQVLSDVKPVDKTPDGGSENTDSESSRNETTNDAHSNRQPKKRAKAKPVTPPSFGSINLGGAKKPAPVDQDKPAERADSFDSKQQRHAAKTRNEDSDSIDSLIAGVSDPLPEQTKPADVQPPQPETVSEFDPGKLALEPFQRSGIPEQADGAVDDGADTDDESQSPNITPADSEPVSPIVTKPANPPPEQKSLNDSYANDDDEDQMGELRISAPVEIPKYEIPSYVADYDAKADEDASNDGKGNDGNASQDQTSSGSRDENVARKHDPLELPDRKVPQLAETYANETAWFKDMLAFLVDAHLIAVWVGLTVVLTIQMFFLRWALQFSQGEQVYQIISFFMMATIVIPLTALLLIGGSVTASNVFQQTAEGNKVMSDWPAFDFFGWIGSSFYYICPLGMSLVPALLVFLVSFPFGVAGWLTPIASLVCVFTVFPMVMLSAVYNQSFWNPYAKPIWDSFSDCFPTWKRFYMRCGVLFLVALTLLLLQLIPSIITMALSAFGLVFVAFIYFRLLGFAGGEIYEYLYRSDS